MTANIPTYEEMKSSGHLGLIKNETLRSKIKEYLIATEASKKIMESLGITIQSNQIYYDKYIRSSADPETLNLSFKYDFESMKKDEEYINKFYRLSVHWRASRYFNQTIFDRSENLKLLIMNEIRA